MLLILSGVSALTSVLKLLVLLVVFFALLYGAHLFTKWYAKSNYSNSKSANISLIESRQIAPGKNIVIARVGKTYVSFVMLKDNAVFLTELQEDELSVPPPQTQNVSFYDILKRARRSAAGNGADQEEDQEDKE